MNNLGRAKDSGLHDYELLLITVDYNHANVNMKFKDLKENTFEICIEKFWSFKIFHEEPWGKGKYVCSSDINYNNVVNAYSLEIELNSGDKIEVIYN